MKVEANVDTLDEHTEDENLAWMLVTVVDLEAGIVDIDARPTEPEPTSDPISDKAALDKLNLLLSAPEWPGASGMEDVCQIVRSTGRGEIPNAPEWGSH